MTTHPLPFPLPLTCAEVDQQLADYLDAEPPGALAPAERAAIDRHITACDRCQAFVHDLGAITQAAAACPPLTPSRDLWDGIAARLGAQELAAPAPAHVHTSDSSPRILAFDVHHVRHPAPERARPGARPAVARGVFWSTRGLAAAAAALVAVTAGTTYLLTRGASAPSDVVAATAPDRRSTVQSPNTFAPNTFAPNTSAPNVSRRDILPADGAPASDAPSPAPATRIAVGPTDGQDASRPVSTASSASTTAQGGATPADLRAVADAAVPGGAVYDREITALRAAVRDRRGDLDSATVAVLVHNLTIIDQAIAQSRAALARDPHSQFLGDQLSRALGQKVDLLRTAALMPRT